MIQPAVTRRPPVDAELLPQGGIDLRVHAPHRRTVEVLFESAGALRASVLQREESGYWSVVLPDGAESIRYRFQPEGPHGASEVIDPAAFRWTDETWPGIDLRGQVIYELHVGTFTPHGTWAAAAGHLEELVDLGVTAVEVMPVAEFPGRYGWGYDGVALLGQDGPHLVEAESGPQLQAIGRDHPGWVFPAAEVTHRARALLPLPGSRPYAEKGKDEVGEGPFPWISASRERSGRVSSASA